MLYYHRTSSCLSRVSQSAAKDSPCTRGKVGFLAKTATMAQVHTQHTGRIDSQTIKPSGNSLLSISSLEYVIVIHVYALLEA